MNKKIAAWLQKGKSITALQALEKWGCMRLAARIENLRKAGMEIKTKTIHKNGKSFAQYHL
jgi:hypothetical protein